MITKVNIKKGILTNLKFPKTWEFNDKVNIIYGPNGCGKSVFLKSLAHYFPTQYPKPLEYSDDKGFDGYLDKAINKLDITYDGGSVNYFDFMMHQDKIGNFNKIQNGGDGSMLEAISQIYNKPSSGQMTIGFINKLLQIPKTVVYPKIYGNEVWEKAQRNFINYYEELPKDGKPTLLLDEIETGLDPDKQLLYLDSVLSTLSQDFQIICVTHNPLVLFFTWYNVINLYPDQSKELKLKIKWLLNKSE